ncbi:hypothetical protein GJAV_G00071880 [Gymnothorax javanicus]|nr:hypothetical protein GJAV_G00071880 [Gymnothorax javanicus]
MEAEMDSTDYNVVLLDSSFIKFEDTEESIEEKNGHGMSRGEELVLSNMKEEEEEEGGEQQCEVVKREDRVKDEEDEINVWESEMEGAEHRDGDVMDQPLPAEKISALKQEALVTSCVSEQCTVPSPGPPAISSRKGTADPACLDGVAHLILHFRKKLGSTELTEQISNQCLCLILRASSPVSLGKDSETGHVMDSTDYTGVVLGSRLIKSEDTEETIEENNGCGIKVEEVIISNVKEEEEEGGEKQSDEVKREDGVKDKEECEMEETLQTDGMLKERSHSKQQEEERSSPLVISSRSKNADIASPGSPSISSNEYSTGESEAFACSQCPFVHMEKEVLHQHMKKVHAEEHCRILGYVGNGAANPLPPCSTNQHPTPPTTVATPTQPNTDFALSTPAEQRKKPILLNAFRQGVKDRCLTITKTRKQMFTGRLVETIQLTGANIQSKTALLSKNFQIRLFG